MKLYVWCDPYSVSYGSSMVFAIAENLRDAKRQAANGKAYAYGEFRQEHVPAVKLGQPHRVVKLPCAEWHEWSE